MPDIPSPPHCHRCTHGRHRLSHEHEAYCPAGTQRENVRKLPQDPILPSTSTIWPDRSQRKGKGEKTITRSYRLPCRVECVDGGRWHRCAGDPLLLHSMGPVFRREKPGDVQVGPTLDVKSPLPSYGRRQARRLWKPNPRDPPASSDRFGQRAGPRASDCRVDVPSVYQDAGSADGRFGESETASEQDVGKDAEHGCRLINQSSISSRSFSRPSQHSPVIALCLPKSLLRGSPSRGNLSTVTGMMRSHRAAFTDAVFSQP